MEEREERSGQDDREEEELELEPLEAGEPGSNLITPAGMKKLKDEFQRLTRDDRPPVLDRIAALTQQGLHLENADYAAAKKRLREIDRRLRFVGRRMEFARVVEPSEMDPESIGFGAKVLTENERGQKKSYHIVGEDEVDIPQGRISWKSPVARGLLDAQVDDWVTIESPSGTLELHIVSIKYD